jgi:hypothetical protein
VRDRWCDPAAKDRVRSDRTRKTIGVPVKGTARLRIDVVNDLAFEGSAALVSQAEPMANRLATLKRRADDLHQRQLRAVALGLSQDGRALHVTLVARPSCVASLETAMLARAAEPNDGVIKVSRRPDRSFGSRALGPLPRSSPSASENCHRSIRRRAEATR